jgi:hypothetical protein
LEIELPDGTILDAPDDADPSKVAKAYLAKKKAPQQTSQPQEDVSVSPWISAAMRPVINAVSSVPGLAADAGIGLRNFTEQQLNQRAPKVAEAVYGINRKLAGDSDIAAAVLPGGYGGHAELLTTGFQREIDKVYAPPSTTLGKGSEFVSSMLLGSRIPAPSAANQAPAGFTKPSADIVRQETLKSSRKAGYAVPPSTTNPSTTNKLLESIAGKIATEQDAATANQSVTNTLAKRALGLSEDAPITQEALGALRREAGDAYEMLRGAGKITTDEEFAAALAKTASKYTGASKDFPKLAKSEITETVDEVLNAKEFSSDSAVDLLAILRDKADKAFATGDKSIGKAYKEIAKAVEDVVQRNLEAAGNKDLLSKFKEARQLIAKSYSVEKAFNPATGNVNAMKLGQQLSKGKPLSGELETAGRFGQAFPKAAREVMDSGSVRNTDVLAGAATTALSGQPWWLLYPFGRQAVRAGLLSDAGQSLAMPRAPTGMPPGLLMGALSGEEDVRRVLLGQ